MPELPTGHVTLLFTDIEDGGAAFWRAAPAAGAGPRARLWEEQPEAMRGALARHGAILRAAIDGSGGRVFKTVGDAFCAVFANASAACRAAIAAQAALRGAPESVDVWTCGRRRHDRRWPVLDRFPAGRCGPPAHLHTSTPPHLHTSTPALRVRMALHAGSAEPRDDDFFGPVVNRVARLLGIAHGGQVLRSGAAREALGDELPADASFIDLGPHRLRDLQSPEQVFQWSGGRADRAPPRRDPPGD